MVILSKSLKSILKRRQKTFTLLSDTICSKLTGTRNRKTIEQEANFLDTSNFVAKYTQSINLLYNLFTTVENSKFIKTSGCTNTGTTHKPYAQSIQP